MQLIQIHHCDFSEFLGQIIDMMKVHTYQQSDVSPYRGGSFLIQREQHDSSKELRRLTLSPQV